MIYIGVDNGVSGGLVALSDHPGTTSLISMVAMPVSKARRGKEIDIRAVQEWVYSHVCRLTQDATIVIEEPGGSKSASAARSMEGSFQALRTMCILRNTRWHRITPQSWQKIMLPGCKAGDTKGRALALAKQLWPNETWLASDKCRTPHEGIIDAALIAEFGRRTKL